MKKLITRGGFYVFLLAFAGISFFPVIWLFITSIKPYQEIYQFPVVYIPSSIVISNYITVFTRHAFSRFFMNSVVVSISSTAICVLLSSCAAYGLSRFKLKQSGLILFIILGFSTFPFIASVIPLFAYFRDLGLLNTYFSLILPYTAFNIPFCVWLTTAYYKEVPVSLEDVAKLDGLSRTQILFQIFMPLSAPVLAAVCIITFVNCWNEFLFALTMISRNTMRTIPAGIALFPGEYDFPWDTISAAACLSIVPIIVFILLFQKMIISGLTSGSVKY